MATNLDEVEGYLIDQAKKNSSNYVIGTVELELAAWLRQRFAELRAREEAKNQSI